jgi:hypothetical protein
VAHSHGLTDEEYAAIRALQEADVVPAVTNLVWEYLLSVGLVRVAQFWRQRSGTRANLAPAALQDCAGLPGRGRQR